MKVAQPSAYLLICLLAFLFCVPCFAQSRTNSNGTGGIHTIQGRIYLPNGRSADSTTVIKLQTSASSDMSVNTDSSGAFIFRGLAPGNYTLVINAGENFEPAREYVTIDADIQPQGFTMPPIPKTVNLYINVQYKPGVAQPAATEVVNARLAAIPKDAIKAYENGMRLLTSDKSAEALIEFRKAIAASPDFSVAMIEAAQITLKAGNLDEAKTLYQSALRVEPKNFEAQLGIGITRLYKQEYADAQKDLELARDLSPTAAIVRYYLGIVFLRLHKNPQAQSEFEEAKKLKGVKDLPLVHYYLGGIYWGENSMPRPPRN
jgi:tetratricopeptide (TPR) repeat protein